jgi:hypothetical protein
MFKFEILAVLAACTCVVYMINVCEACNGTGANWYILAERRLLACLLGDSYNPDVRPALNPKDTVNVTLDSIMGSVVDLDEKTGMLTTELWLIQKWLDPQLTWIPEQFDGITQIQVPIEKIWNPSIVLHNNADESFRYIMDKLAMVQSNGSVTWVPHGRLRSWCELDMRLFPFDTQHCYMLFGSWSYDKALVHVNIIADAGQRKFIQKSTEWDIDGYRTEYREIPYSGGGIQRYYPMVIFEWSMRRTSLFYKYMLVGPSVILVILTLALYWVPIQSGERFMLAAGVLVSTTTLLVILEGCLPTDMSNLPVVASYMCYNLVFLLVTILISILVFNCYHRDIKRSAVPRLVRTVCLGWLGKLCCVSAGSYTALHSHEHRPRQLEEGGSLEHHSTSASNSTSDPAAHVASSSGSSSSGASLEKTMEDIRRYLRVLATKPDSVAMDQESLPSHRELVVNEWQRVALVIDRVSFGLFLFVSIAITMALYGRS